MKNPWQYFMEIPYVFKVIVLIRKYIFECVF